MLGVVADGEEVVVVDGKTVTNRRDKSGRRSRKRDNLGRPRDNRVARTWQLHGSHVTPASHYGRLRLAAISGKRPSAFSCIGQLTTSNDPPQGYKIRAQQRAHHLIPFIPHHDVCVPSNHLRAGQHRLHQVCITLMSARVSETAHSPIHTGTGESAIQSSFSPPTRRFL